MTGVDPGRHGIYSFTRPDSDYREKVITAAERQAASVWQRVSAAGPRVGVFNLPLSYPPEAVNGFFFSGFDAPVFGPQIAHPAGAFEIATQGLTGYIHEGAAWLRDEAAAEEASRQARQQRDMLLRLTAEWPVEVLALNFMAVDHIHHYAWPLGWTTEQLAASSGSAVEHTYRALDSLLGDLLETYADEQTHVVLASDHGGGRLLGQVTLEVAFAEAGLLVRHPRPRSSPLTAALRAARKYLPRGLKTRLHSLQGAALRRAVGNQFRAELGAGVDWSRTVAFPWGSRGFIQVNERGRQPEGCVAPEDREKVLADVEACLHELRDPVTGQPVIGGLFRGEELYREPRAGYAPDLLAEGTADEYSVRTWWTGEDRPDGSVIRFRTLDDCPGRLTANHRPWGVFAACGPHIPAGGAVPDLEMVDLAPVLLRLAGVPIPAGLDGKLPPWLPSAAPEPGLASAEQAAPPPPTASPYSPEEESAVQRRLADLGYM